MTFELTILGSGSALPTSRRYPTAQALNVLGRFFLIDCGEGAQLQLRNSKIKFGHINNIFISHLHGDHVFGLFGLLSTYNLLGRKTPLTIYGPSDIEKIISFYRQQFAEELQYAINIVSLVPGSLDLIFDDKVVSVYSFPLKHRVPSWGFLFKEKARQPNIRKEAVELYKPGIKDILSIKQGADFKTEEGKIIPNKELVIEPPPPRSYAYCSDTAFYGRIAKWIEGVDLLYHEATFADQEKKIAKQTAHSTASQAAMIAKKAQVKQLILGHFSNRYKDLDILLNEAIAIFPNTVLADDLQSYPIKKPPLSGQ